MPVNVLPTHEAKLAIDDAFDHYFTNLTSDDKKESEILFLADLITEIEPWLFFTDDSLDNIYKRIGDSSANTNLINSLTLLFYMRYTPTKDYLHQLAVATPVGECEDSKLSFMPQEYRDRTSTWQTTLELLKNNRSLVMLFTMIMYFDTGILAANLSVKK